MLEFDVFMVCISQTKVKVWIDFSETVMHLDRNIYKMQSMQYGPKLCKSLGVLVCGGKADFTKLHKTINFCYININKFKTPVFIDGTLTFKHIK